MKKLDRELLAKNLEETMAADFAEGKVGGASLYVSQDGECLYHKHFGLSGVTEGDPINDSTVYRLASMTKPITAVAAMILVERGLLRMDDYVDTYLPEFTDMDVAKLENDEIRIVGKAKTRLTVLHLLTHTSGIGSGMVGMAQDKLMTPEIKATLDNSIAFYASNALAFEPFTTQAYSGVASFSVFVKIAEKVTGMDYETFLRKNIFEPCGMKDTGFIPTEDQWSRMVGMHDRVEEKSVCKPMKEGCVFGNYPCTHFLGGAGLFSTLPDYSRFAEMLLRGGEIDGNRILTEESVRYIGTPKVPETIMGPRERWGLAVRVIVGEHCMTKGCFGWSGAYGTHFWVDPENRIVAVYLKNCSYDGGAGCKTGNAFERNIYKSFSDAK